MRFSRSFGAVAAGLLSLGIPVSTSWAAVPTAATRSLLADKPGLRGAVTGERLTSLYGAVLADSNEQAYAGTTTTDQFVDEFLVQRQAAFSAVAITLTLCDRKAGLSCEAAGEVAFALG